MNSVLLADSSVLGIGELAGLTAAILWTISSMLWGRIHLSALAINFCKNVLGSVMVAVHLMVLVVFTGREKLLEAPAESWGWLALSGLVGVVVGDTLYFRSLQILGPRRALMMATVGPIFSAMLGWTMLKETLTLSAITGVIMTVGGVFVVVSDRKAKTEEPGLMPGRIQVGIWTGLGGAFCQAVGGVFSKLGMRDDQGIEICDPAEATLIRLLISAIVSLVVVRYRNELGTILKRAAEPKTVRMLIAGTALGTWLGVWMSQIAYSFANVAVAQTLLATCPIFAIPAVWLVDKHRVTYLSIVGTLIAIMGISLVVRHS